PRNTPSATPTRKMSTALIPPSPTRDPQRGRIARRVPSSSQSLSYIGRAFDARQAQHVGARRARQRAGGTHRDVAQEYPTGVPAASQGRVWTRGHTNEHPMLLGARVGAGQAPSPGAWPGALSPTTAPAQASAAPPPVAARAAGDG